MEGPPLIGDGRGLYKIHIFGNSGSGKSTLATHLSLILGIPHISLDQLFWEPNWKAASEDEFRAKIRAAMEQSPNGWIIDGDYQRRGGVIVQEEATDVIWLDPPLILYFPRIVIRTFLRIVGFLPPCSPGCPETFKEVFFSKNSILLWCLTQHGVNRRRGESRMKEIGIGVGTQLENRKMRRISGWGNELERWIKSVKDMIQEK
ncbi:AAA domain-containing protein [Armillaria borealis]|uniref:AAA domain-containing protein n=1 Tax=Armillaria borealis TaxID=47425 RepID=A0AA39IE17_9AGAR|nr:AAA domain-containing protein [Armillaria borealis]